METLHSKITKSDTGDKSNIRVESGLVTDNTTQSVKGATAQFHNAHRTRLAFFILCGCARPSFNPLFDGLIMTG